MTMRSIFLFLFLSPLVFAMDVLRSDSGSICDESLAMAQSLDRLISALQIAIMRRSQTSNESGASLAQKLYIDTLTSQLLARGISAQELAKIEELALQKEKDLLESAQQVPQNTLKHKWLEQFQPLPAVPTNLLNVNDDKLAIAFEMMRTKVTQEMWIQIMGSNPAHFSGGADAQAVEFQQRFIGARPQHPIENITWWSALIFANRLSEMFNLPPAYRLDDHRIVFVPGTSAEAGTLAVDEDHYIEPAWLVNHESGDIRRTEGFRLPTLSESKFVKTNLGQTNRPYKKYPFDVLGVDIRHYAWTSENSGAQTHAVGTTQKSFEILGAAFADLIGNVQELQGDILMFSFDNKRHFNHARYASGGCWSGSRSNVEINTKKIGSTNFRSNCVGLRLVRSRHTRE